MSSENIDEASGDISTKTVALLRKLAPKLRTQYGLTEQQLAIAFSQSAIQVAAMSVSTEHKRDMEFSKWLFEEIDTLIKKEVGITDEQLFRTPRPDDQMVDEVCRIVRRCLGTKRNAKLDESGYGPGQRMIQYDTSGEELRPKVKINLDVRAYFNPFNPPEKEWDFDPKTGNAISTERLKRESPLVCFHIEPHKIYRATMALDGDTFIGILKEMESEMIEWMRGELP